MRLEPYLVSMATSYLKRVLDPRYDRLAWRSTLRNIRKRPARERRTIEALLYALAAVVEVHMDDRTAVRTVLKDLFSDGAAEIGSRIMNHPIRDEQSSRHRDTSASSHIAWLDRATEHLTKPLF